MTFNMPNFEQYELLSRAMRSRYAPDREQDLRIYFDLVGFNNANAKQVAKSFETVIRNPQLENTLLDYPEYTLPAVIIKNNTLVRIHVLQQLELLQEQLEDFEVNQDDFIGFFVKQHENIKWAMNQWLLATPGVSLELYRISEDLPVEFKEWLRSNFDIHPGDQVIHRHVISNNGRQRLVDIGFDIPDMQWAEVYYRDALAIAYDLAITCNLNKGIFSDGSWIYDSNLYPQGGKPLVKFTYLADNSLVGHRFPLRPEWLSEDKFATQVRFASRSNTRKSLIEAGEYQPTVVGVFYPLRELADYLRENPAGSSIFE